MQSTTLLPPLAYHAPAQPGIERTSAAMVFLPKEHGSWSLALEPLALGLLVAPSWAGAALATAAIAGFFARRPLKAALTAAPLHHRERALPALALFVAIIALAVTEAGLLGGLSALWPLLLAAPLGGFFLYFDLQNDSRATAAEIVGSGTFALVPAAIATLAGWPTPAALALSVVALARNLPTVLTVRTYLRHAKGQQSRATLPLLTAALACTAVAALRLAGLVPAVVMLIAAIHFCRSVWLLSSLRPHWTARRIGQLEAALGLFYLGLIAGAYHVA